MTKILLNNFVIRAYEAEDIAHNATKIQLLIDNTQYNEFN